MTVAQTNEVSAALAAPAPPRDSFGDWLDRQKPQIARILGSAIDSDKFIMFAMTAVRQTPELMKCTPESMLAALMLSAQVGLEPGPFGLIYLNPRNRKVGDGWVKEVQFSIGYKGLVALAQRSPQIKKVQGHVVYANDVFSVEYGLNENLIHKPNLSSDRGEVVGSYAVAEWANGAKSFVYLTRADIDKRRAAAGKGGESGPWKTHYEQMARKSAVRDLANFLPLDTDVVQAVALDDQVHTDANTPLLERQPAPFNEQDYAEGIQAIEAAAEPFSGPVPPGTPVSGVVVPEDGSVPPAPAQAPSRGRSRPASPPASPPPPAVDENGVVQGDWPPVAVPGSDGDA